MSDTPTFCTLAELAALTSMFKDKATAESFCQRLAVAGPVGAYKITFEQYARHIAKRMYSSKGSSCS